MTARITQDILDFAKNAKNTKSSIINLLEDQEDWVSKNPDIEEKVENIIMNWSDILKTKNPKKDTFIRLMAYLSTGQMINFLNAIEKMDKKFVDELLESINQINSNDKFKMILSQRLLVIYRMSIIPKVFSPERLQALENEINKL
jgi:hypothetical protein